MNDKLSTERLILRRYGPDDLENMQALLSEEQVWKFSTVVPSDNSDEARSRLKGFIDQYDKEEPAFMALTEKDSGLFIGEAGVLAYKPGPNRAVVGYNLLPAFWGNGYATEITEALVSYLFDEISVERIEALVVENNIASANVLAKCGFLREGLLRHFGRIRGAYVNLLYFGMIIDDFETLRRKQ